MSPCSKPYVWWQAEQEYRDTEQLVQTLSEYEAILRQVAQTQSHGEL